MYEGYQPVPYEQMVNPNGIIEDDTQAFLVKIAKKMCRQMTLGSLFEVLKIVEKCCDKTCPEWRKLDR